MKISFMFSASVIATIAVYFLDKKLVLGLLLALAIYNFWKQDI